MSFVTEKREALMLLEDIENGITRGADTGYRLDNSDPALVYFILTWLRHRYSNDPAMGPGVLGRIVAITAGHNSVTEKMNEGKVDPIVEWFEEAHEYKEFGAEAFIDLVIEKLES